jgi:hypothetical protein
MTNTAITTVSEFFAKRGLSCASTIVELLTANPSLHYNPKVQDVVWGKFVNQQQRQLLPQEFNTSRAVYDYIFSTRNRFKDGPPIVWTPDTATIERSNIQTYFRLSQTNTIRELHRWSMTNPDLFWGSYIDEHIHFRVKPNEILSLKNKGDNSSRMEHALWLPQAEYNIVESCFTFRHKDSPAIVFSSETDSSLHSWSIGYLQDLVQAVATGLRESCKIKKGDRVGIFMPMNATVQML